jgi:serine/threonine protein kinase
MAPEVVQSSHSKPDSVGYSRVEMQNVIKGRYFKNTTISNTRYSFDAPEWEHVSTTAKEFINKMLVVNPQERMTISQALAHPWIKKEAQGTTVDLLPRVTKAFNGKKAFKKAVDVVIAIQKIQHPKPEPEGDLLVLKPDAVPNSGSNKVDK